MIASVQKAMRILSAIADGAPEPMPLCEIAKAVNINKATCSHIVDTLMQEGFLVRISSSRGYVLGPAAYCLTGFERYGRDLISTTRPVMQYLYKTLGYCVVLAVIEGSTKYVIDYIDDGTIFEKKEKIRRDDIYRTATGRAILENMSDSEITAVWEKYGKPSQKEWAEIETFEDLLRYKSTSSSRTVTVTRAEGEDGAVNIGYGAPIFRGMTCVGAIGIAVKLKKNEEKAFLSKEQPKIESLLQKGAFTISERL